jgi:hypothetical protein
MPSERLGVLRLARCAPCAFRQGILKQAHEVNELKRLPDEWLNSQPFEAGIHGFSAVRAGDNYFEIGRKRWASSKTSRLDIPGKVISGSITSIS